MILAGWSAWVSSRARVWLAAVSVALPTIWPLPLIAVAFWI
jgi:hypothetical protein